MVLNTSIDAMYLADFLDKYIGYNAKRQHVTFAPRRAERYHIAVENSSFLVAQYTTKIFSIGRIIENFFFPR